MNTSDNDPADRVDPAHNDELALDALIRNAIRDVPPVDPDVREQHIAVALAELSGRTSRSARGAIRRQAVAAAVAVLLAGAGFALGRAGSGTDAGLADGSGTSVSETSTRTETPVKGNASTEPVNAPDPGVTGSQMQTSASRCDESIALDPIARYDSDAGWRIAYIRDVPTRTLLIVDEASCTVLQEIDLP